MNESQVSIYDEKYAGQKAIDTIRAMDNMREVIDDLDKRLTELNKEYDFLRHNLVPKLMEQEGIDSIRVEGVGRVSLTGDMYVRVLAEHRELVNRYFRDLGKASLITESINPSTLKATVKAMIRSGETFPEDLIKVTPFTRASITKR
jgi:hypothetical protein